MDCIFLHYNDNLLIIGVMLSMNVKKQLEMV